MLRTPRLVVFGAMVSIVACGTAFAQETPTQHPIGPGAMQQMMESGRHPNGAAEMQEMMSQHRAMMPMAGHGGMHAGAALPTIPGQDAFGATQEIVSILEADPKTDWSKVDLEGLRQHLIDMNEVTLKADATPKPIDSGLEIRVTGNGRALVAIQQMIPAWAGAMNGYHGWSTKAFSLPNGELLTVTTTDPKEIQHIRGLGYIGLLVSGSFHQMHHLAMAKGEFDHDHLAHAH